MTNKTPSKPNANDNANDAAMWIMLVPVIATLLIMISVNVSMSLDTFQARREETRAAYRPGQSLSRKDAKLVESLGDSILNANIMRYNDMRKDYQMNLKIAKRITAKNTNMWQTEIPDPTKYYQGTGEKPYSHSAMVEYNTFLRIYEDKIEERYQKLLRQHILQK